MRKEKTHITVAGLKESGWTDSLIKNFLGEPDLLKQNPFYKKSAAMKLYSLDRVSQIELLPDFLSAKEKSAKRKISAQKAVATKTKNTLEEMREKFKFHIHKPLEEKELFKLAVKHYNNFHRYKKSTNMGAGRDFLIRISLNYIRHKRSNYEDVLDCLNGKVGKLEAREIMHELVYEKMKEIGLEHLITEYESYYDWD